MTIRGPLQSVIDDLLSKYQNGELGASEKIARSTIKEHPDFLLGWKILAAICQRTGRLQTAIDTYRHAIKLDPGDAEAHNNLGVALRNTNSLDEAEASYKQALTLRPGYPEAHNNLGALQKQKGQTLMAEASFREAIALKPDYSGALTNLGGLLQGDGRLEEAEAVLGLALKLQPDSAAATNTLGLVLKDLGRLLEAETAFRRATELDPNDSDAFHNLGFMLQELGRIDEAIDFSQAAIRLKPGFSNAHLNLGMTFLRDKTFDRGFELFEWRWKTEQYLGQKYSGGRPRWNGEFGKSILVWSEQGIGDFLMFATVIEELYEKSFKVIVSCDERLCALLRRSFPTDLEFVPQGADFDGGFDYEIPIGSLPLFFRKNLSQFKRASGQFLKPNPVAVGMLRRRLLEVNPRGAIGISWRGGTKRNRFRDRDIELSVLAESLADLGLTLVSLQYGSTSEEIGALRKSHGIEVFEFPDIDNFNDIDDLAALISACDQVVCIDNSISHLAGALGQKAAVMLPFSADWRWGSNARTSYWHNSLSLWRQEAIFDWDSVLSRLRQKLKRELTKG